MKEKFNTSIANIFVSLSANFLQLTKRIGDHCKLASGSPELTRRRSIQEYIPTRQVKYELQYSQSIWVALTDFPYNNRHDSTDDRTTATNNHTEHEKLERRTK